MSPHHLMRLWSRSWRPSPGLSSSSPWSRGWSRPACGWPAPRACVCPRGWGPPSRPGGAGRAVRAPLWPRGRSSAHGHCSSPVIGQCSEYWAVIGWQVPEAEPPDPSSGARGSEASGRSRGFGGRGPGLADSPAPSRKLWWSPDCGQTRHLAPRHWNEKWRKRSIK